MHPELAQFLARDRARTLAEEAAADSFARGAGRRPNLVEQSISIRLSRPCDTAALERLAALDSSTCPSADFVVALREGRIVAAVSLGEDAVLSDPFEPTAEVIELLRLRAAQVRHADRTWRIWHRRGGPAPA
jgi:hypothetical protein